MSETRTQKRPRYSCWFRGPGPVYKLPTLVGYEQHDPSRYRNPAYTLRKRLGLHEKVSGPGPVYDVTKLTRKGAERPPAFTIAGRQPFKVLAVGPGPGAYHPETCPPMNHSKRPPAYSLKARKTDKYRSDTPAPNMYEVPSCLGPRIPDKRALGAFTITGLRHSKVQSVGPGPAAYANYRVDTIKPKYPAFSLKSRPKSQLGPSIGPGPVYNVMYNKGKNAPKFSFGVRHSECAPPAFTELDNEE